MGDEVKILALYPASYRSFDLDKAFPHVFRKTLLIIASLSSLSLLFALPITYLRRPEYASQILGALLISLVIFILLLLIEFFYYSNLRPSRTFKRREKEYSLGIEAARIFRDAEILKNPSLAMANFLRAFEKIQFYRILFLRLGVEPIPFISENVFEAQLFYSKLLDYLDKNNHEEIWLADVLGVLIQSDKTFADFLFGRKIKREDFLEAAEWVEYLLLEDIKRKRWWDWENLSQIPGIGTDLGYGYTFTLDKYSRDLLGGEVFFSRETRKNEIKMLEEALSRSYEANVLLVGEEGSGKHAVLDGLADRVREGNISVALRHKRMVVLDYESAVAYGKTKGAYQELIIQIFNEAVGAGNILLIIENFAGFIASSSALGVDIVSLIENYISSDRIQIVALSDIASFHRELEPSGKIMKLFEKIEVGEPAPERALKMLEDTALVIEGRSGKIFILPALRHALRLAERYITEGALPEKAIDVLDEATSSLPQDRTLIYPEDIEKIVEKRTRIPTSKAEGEEVDKLLHLEDLLHGRLVGQEEAIRRISDALRRARSGLKPENRPIGSFLFLGPTGVGKTETAKALSSIYFGGEDAMIRFDMSEFSGADGLGRLIGRIETKEPGLLASHLRERPYCLLLLDEFEKATREVHNLFLQILDEGLFSDGTGRRVSARETMIIATSNAGSGIVWDLLAQGKDPAEIESVIIDGVRREGHFSPELLNRFDAIVVYHPLKKEELECVALLILEALGERLKKQEIIFNPTLELARRVVEIGFDRQFGARPMRRAVADRIEQVIAKKILSGDLKRGDTFSFSQEKIAKL